MNKKQTLPKTKTPAAKPKPPAKERKILSPYDEREAPEYREHDDFREWLMRDTR